MRSYLTSTDDVLSAGESLSQYAYRGQVDDLAWVRGQLNSLAKALLPARFRIQLIITAGLHEYRLVVSEGPTGLSLLCEDAREHSELTVEPQAVGALEILQELITTNAIGLDLEALCQAIDDVTAHAGIVRMQLDLFLDKKAINQRLLANGDATSCVVSFLFPDALLKYLAGCQLLSFEQEFFKVGARTVIPIFGSSGLLRGELLAVLGADCGQTIDDLISGPISSAAIKRNLDALAFRQSEGIWVQSTLWLTPEVLGVSTQEPCNTAGKLKSIKLLLACFQAVLSAIFLADSVQLEGEKGYWVEYRGLGKARFLLQSCDSTFALADCPDSVYSLYSYAYDGFSPDKLSIAQQFLSLMISDSASLCGKALEVRDATKKTYERLLIGNVKDYFESRQKIQERIKNEVDGTAKSVTGLSRDVSSDLYKLCGLVLAAAVGALLKPDLSLVVGFSVAAGIALYLGLVIWYYIPTMKWAYNLGLDQNEAYIRSFGEVLRQEEINTFICDKRLQDAKTLFSDRSEWASRIYTALFILSMVVTIVLLIWQLFLLIPAIHAGIQPPLAIPTSTPIATLVPGP